MRCKTCDYPLWQLKARQCPECGTAFLPSDFEFTLNSVRFCCPHCEQAYYGTGPRGHLVPRTFACVSCAKTIDMDEMVLLPSEGVTEAQTEVTVVPWVNRGRRGWFTSFFVTMGMAMGNPNRTIAAVPEGSPASRAIVYMSIHTVLQMLLSGFPFVIWILMMGAMLASGGGAAMGFIAGFLISMVATPIIVLGWSCVVHGLLRMTGPTLGLRRTLHATCYSAGNNFISAVPCLSVYVFWAGALWWTISCGFMLAKAHNARAWRVWIAVGVPILLAIGLLVGGIVAMVYGVQSATARVAATMPGMTSIHATPAAAGQRLATALYTTEMSRARPAHPAEMLLDHNINPQELLLPTSSSDTLSCRVHNITLNELSFGFGSKASTYRKVLQASAPGSPPAIRVGDFVFTYSGMPMPPPDTNLWLAIGWPDPALNTGDPSQVVLVLPGDVSNVVPIAQFDALLVEQNSLRAKNGLPPLPHPRTVFATSVKQPSLRTVRPPPPPASTPPGGTGDDADPDSPP